MSTTDETGRPALAAANRPPPPLTGSLAWQHTTRRTTEVRQLRHLAWLGALTAGLVRSPDRRLSWGWDVGHRARCRRGRRSVDAAPSTPPQARVPAIRATGIVKRFGHLEALRGASIDLHPREIVALVGDNGAGKSTLTKVISGALTADEGDISFWGQPTRVTSIHDAHELGVHTVYQDLALAPHLSVADNLFLGREHIGTGWRRFVGALDRRTMVDETREAMSRLGISLRDYSVPVGNLSGGQRQALAVARAITWATTAVLMDEPTAALGPKQSAIVYQTVAAAADRGLAVLVISHDIPRMLEVAHHIAVMRHGAVIAVRDTRSVRLTDVIGLMLGEDVEA